MTFLNIKPSLVASSKGVSAADRHPMIDALREAAKAFGARRQTGNAATCRDMAAALDRFGSFRSEKQEDYANKLVSWSKQSAPANAPLTVPKFFDVLQKHSQFIVGAVTFRRKNQDSLVWIKHDDAEKVIGKIEGGVVTLWQRPGIDLDAVRRVIAEMEIDPLEAAKRHGRLSGICCSCGRDLTDPASIEAGIGPICAQRFN